MLRRAVGVPYTHCRIPEAAQGVWGPPYPFPVPLRCWEQAGPRQVMPSSSQTSGEPLDASELWSSHVVTAQAVGFGNFRVGFGVIANKIPTH